MDMVRDNISNMRLSFIKTVDKHTEIDQVTYYMYKLIETIKYKIHFRKPSP